MSLLLKASFQRRPSVVACLLALVAAGCSNGSNPSAPVTAPASAAVKSHAAEYHVAQSFLNAPDEAEGPRGNLVLHDGRFYGIAGGGYDGNGTIFSVSKTEAPKTLYRFKGGTTDGSMPADDIVLADGKLYGTLQLGGANRGGAIFSFDPATGTEKLVYSFKNGDDGGVPLAGLAFSDGVLWGTTNAFGQHGKGGIFRYRLSDGSIEVIHQFGPSPDSSQVVVPLIIGNEGGVTRVFGASRMGGSSDFGTIFAYDLDGKKGGVILDCDGNNLATPHNPMLYLFDTGNAQAIGSVGLSFKNTDAGFVWEMINANGEWKFGAVPFEKGAGLSPQGVTWYKYSFIGVFAGGGTYGGGVLYSRHQAYGFKALHQFGSPNEGVTDGRDPFGTPLVENDVIYGTTARGGANGKGTFWWSTTGR